VTGTFAKLDIDSAITWSSERVFLSDGLGDVREKKLNQKIAKLKGKCRDDP